MRIISTLVTLTASLAVLSTAQSTSSDGIMTIQPITSIIPSSLISTPPPLTEATRTSTRIGGSQVEPSSFTTSRRIISDASTDRPPPSSATTPSSTSDVLSSLTATIPAITSSIVASASSAAASATTSAAPNAAAKPIVGASAGVFGVLAALGGALLV